MSLFLLFIVPVVAQILVPPPVPPVIQPVYPYLRRFYVLFNLQRPAEMLERGVREYIANQMKGRPIGGMIYRSTLPDYDQCLIIRASGTPGALELFENTVLDLTDEEGNDYWECSRVYKPEEALTKLASYEFTIGQSSRGAVRGPNSDPKYDNKSEKSSKTGKSSKSGK